MVIRQSSKIFIFLLDPGTVTGFRKGVFSISINFKAGSQTLVDFLKCAHDPESLSPLALRIRFELEHAKTF